MAHIDGIDATDAVKSALRLSAGAVLDGYREELPFPWAHYADVFIKEWRSVAR